MSGVFSVGLCYLGIAITMKAEEVEYGVASAYREDKGLGLASGVLLADGFERYNVPSQMLRRNGGQWDGINGASNWAIDSVVKHSGNRSARVDFPITGSEWSKSLHKVIGGEPLLFVRAYMRYSSGFHQLGGHRGISMAGDFNVGPCGGTPRNGLGWFVFMLQNYVCCSEQQPGWGHIYAYWPFQASSCGDHWYPDGDGFNAWKRDPGGYRDFVPRAKFEVPRGEWFCYELMVRENRIGARDGEVKVWVNGVVKADFPDLFIRGRSNLLIDSIILVQHMLKNYHVGDHAWWDDVVISRDYIGPMVR